MSAEYRVHLVGVIRPSACRVLYMVCKVGKLAQDVGMMWKCHGVIPI